MGYADYKVYYESNDPQAALNLRIHITPATSYLRICAQNHKESLKHALFYLDANVTVTVGGVYTPTPQRVLLTQRKYVGEECTVLSDLPPGKHVLGVNVNPAAAGARSIVSHLVMYD